MHLPDFKIWRAVSDKASFSTLMDRFSVPHPRGAVISEGESVAAAAIGLKPPYVLKASDSTEYFRHPFPGQRKVYFLDSISECTKTAEKIFNSGYGARLLLQERVGLGGAPAVASVLTAYCDKSGRVVTAVRGDVLLEERGRTSRGNYSAIVTSPLTKIDLELISLLEGIGYTGIANFDILRSDSGEVCLELNPRQGRSFDYMRAAGINLANLIIDEMCGSEQMPHFMYKEGFWREVGLRTVEINAEDPVLLARAVKLEREGKGIFAYDPVRGQGISHKLYVAVHTARCGRRFLKYKKEADGYASV
jgi:D-aspartate ligase